MDTSGPMKVILIILIIFFLISFFRMSGSIFRRRMGFMFTWLMITAVLVTGYIYWDDFKNTRIYTSLVPGAPLIKDDGTIILTRANDGHYHVEAKVNGYDIKFLIDTGASVVTLTRNDAEKIGIPTYKLKFDQVFSTANGTTRGAAISLNSVVIGNAGFTNVRASVNQGQMRSSLLGMSFLDKLTSYRVEGNKLIIVP